jgi:glycosyltransferase involved in cell wall biosynthesis
MLREATVAGWPTNPTLVPQLLRDSKALPILIGYYLSAMALSGLALGALRRPWVFWTDTLKPPGESRATPLQQAIAGRTRRWFLDRSTACLTTGEVGRRSLLKNGVADSRIFSLPFVVDADWIRSSVDAKRPEREAIRASLGVPPDQKLLLYVGQIVELKRLDLLIDALSELRKKGVGGIGVLLVGEGPAVPELKEQVARLQLGDIVRFRPAQRNVELPGLWAATDCFVIPSRQDAWPVVVVEALTAGLPVLGSTGCGSVVDRVKPGETGWIFKNGELADLVEKLEAIVACDFPKLRAMGDSARASMEEWSPRAMAQQFTKIVEGTFGLFSRGSGRA